MEWSENFSVMNRGMDEQHKKLINIMNQIINLISTKNYYFENLLELVHQMDDYVREHLVYEEKLMLQHSFPEMLEHVMEHDELRKRMKSINLFEVSDVDGFYRDTLVYLVDWLSIHIMQTDKRFGQYLLNQK